MINIYFDFDDVISDLYPAVKDLVRFIYGWTPPENFNLFCMDEQEKYGGEFVYNNIPIIERDIHNVIAMVMYGNVHSIPIRKDAVDFFSINKFKHLNILTARTACLRGIMEDWFSINLPYMSKAIYNSQGSNYKAQMLQELGATHYVEDQYRVAKTIADVGIPTFLLNKSYNQGFPPHDNIIRINELTEINTYLDFNNENN